MENIKISVIIPVYNTEKHLKKCLESVINQSLSDIEIICVNDGSVDNSLNILEEYARLDSRIVLINQENKGVSRARNIALKLAGGEYIAFLDSDDWFENNALETAYEEIKRNTADILLYGANIFIDNKFSTNSNTKLIKKIMTGKGTITDFINLNIVVWDKLFRTNFLKENKILFPEEIVIAEDGIFCLLAHFAGAKYAYLNKCLYNHNDFVINSATSNCNYAIKEDLRAFKYLFNLKIFQTQNKDIQLAIVNKFCGGAIFYWSRLEDENYRNVFYEEMINLKIFIEQHYTKKELKTQKGYSKLLKRIKQYKGLFPYNILCKMKFRKYKLIRIMGFEKKIPL